MVRHHQQWKSDKQRYARDFGDGDESVDDSLMKVVQELLPCRGGDVDSLHDDNMMYLSDSLVSETAFNGGGNLASREASSVSGLRPFSISGSLMEQKDYQETVRTPSKHSKNSGISSNGTRSKNGLKPFSLSPFKSIKKKGSKSSSIFDGITESGLGRRDTSGKFSDSGVNSRGLSHVISRASTPLSLASQGPFLSPDSLSSVSGLSSTESRDYWSNRLRSGDSVGSIEKDRKEKAESFWSYKPGKSATGFFSMFAYDNRNQISSNYDSKGRSHSFNDGSLSDDKSSQDIYQRHSKSSNQKSSSQFTSPILSGLSNKCSGDNQDLKKSATSSFSGGRMICAPSVVENESILSSVDGLDMAIEVECLKKDSYKDAPVELKEMGSYTSSEGSYSKVLNKRGRIWFGVAVLAIVIFTISLVSGLTLNRGTSRSSSLAQVASIQSSTPSVSPSNRLSDKPSQVSTRSPTTRSNSPPSNRPSMILSQYPSKKPSRKTTTSPSFFPSVALSDNPTQFPTLMESEFPTQISSETPTLEPSRKPSVSRTFKPTLSPSYSIIPTVSPSKVESDVPSRAPSRDPTQNPSDIPSISFSNTPTHTPTNTDSALPTTVISEEPTQEQSQRPSARPTPMPTLMPSEIPTLVPSNVASRNPSGEPSTAPSETPSKKTRTPSLSPTGFESEIPTIVESDFPTSVVSEIPTVKYSLRPSDEPSASPTQSPSFGPSVVVTDIPSREPSIPPTKQPSEPLSPMELFAIEFGLWLPSNPKSPLSLALNWAKSQDYPTSRQRIALATLYFSTGGDNWADQLNFLSEEDECTWNIPFVETTKGIMCDENGNVAAVSLFDHGLAKQLPGELRLLTHLQVLNLNGNTLTGVLPTQLGRLSNLVQLDIGNNLISGTIPTELGMITTLEEIITRNNQLWGSIPLQLSNIPYLHAFWADRNDISGDLTTLCEKNKALVASTDCDQVICPCCSICCYNNAECAFSSSFNK